MVQLYQMGDDSHLYRVRNKLVSVAEVNPPADIASGRIAEAFLNYRNDKERGTLCGLQINGMIMK